MNPDIEALWTRVLAGAAVAADKDELLAKVGEDAAAWPALLLDQRMDGLLRGLGHACANEPRFVANAIDQWKSAQRCLPSKRPRKWWPRLAVAAGLIATSAFAAWLWRNQETPPGGTTPAETPGRSAPAAADLPRLIAPADPGAGPEDGAAAERTAVDSPPGDTVRVLHLDFEDGAVPEILTTGGVVTGPARAGNKFCAIGGVSPWTLRANVVALTGGPQGLLAYDGQRSLRFRYWVGADAQRIVVQTKNLRQQQNFNAAIAPLVHEEWAGAPLPLGALEPFDQRRPMEAGDPLFDILIMAGALGGSALYLDDIQIIETSKTPPENR